jgi:trans-aconitate methyltransferase
MSSYAITAQYYDVMAADQHARVDAQIAAMLHGFDTSAGPFVDIGAGTGLTTRVIASALPDAEILAVEQDPSMRAALMTRVCSDSDLRRRVTILPMSILDASLPASISGAVMSAALVHFNSDERALLWRVLARHLAPNGRIVLEIQCPEAIDIPETRMATGRIGRVDYEGYARATRLDDERQSWAITYRALMDGVEIEKQTAHFVCHAANGSRVIEEAAAAGLIGRIDGDLVVLQSGRHERR